VWDARQVIVDRDAEMARALVEEACRKSALVWLRPIGTDRSQAVWHVWVDGAVHVVTGGIEQPLPDLGDGSEVDVTARSKDTWGRMVTFRATVSTVAPGDDAWDTGGHRAARQAAQPAGRRGAARAVGPRVPGRPDRADRPARRGARTPVAPVPCR
jgi:hypothetical protein